MFLCAYQSSVGEQVGGEEDLFRMSKRGVFLALFLFSSCLTVTFFVSQGVTSVRAEASVVELPPMNLTVVGANGTEALGLNETSIAALPSYSGYGGFKNQIGNLNAYGNYTGVSLETLCNLVSGLTNTSVVRITASDGYVMNFTYAQVKGEFVTYDNVTGAEVDHTQPLVPIVAYYLNGSNIPSSDGPLRLAIVSPEGYATVSAYWVKLVVRIEIIETAIPEFPHMMFLPLFLLASLASVLVLKVQRQRRHCSIYAR